MLYLVMTASLKDIIEANEVALDISIWINNTITYSCLSSKVDYNVYVVVGEDLVDEGLVGDIAFNERPGVVY